MIFISNVSAFNNKHGSRQRVVALANEGINKKLIDDKLEIDWKTNPAELKLFKGIYENQETLKTRSN